MTTEQKEQLARGATTIVTNTKRVTKEDLYQIVLWALNARDEEVEKLKSEIHTVKYIYDKCKSERNYLETELNKAKNPWVSVEERMPEEGQSVVVRNYYGDKGYNHCVCVFKGGKFVVVVTNLTTGETQEIENNYVKAWMPIPKGGE